MEHEIRGERLTINGKFAEVVATQAVMNHLNTTRLTADELRKLIDVKVVMKDNIYLPKDVHQFWVYRNDLTKPVIIGEFHQPNAGLPNGITSKKEIEATTDPFVADKIEATQDGLLAIDTSSLECSVIDIAIDDVYEVPINNEGIPDGSAA